MEYKLKPCPRCGKIPELTWDYYNADYDKVVYTICECNFNGILSFTEEEAIDIWNKKCRQYLARRH